MCLGIIKISANRDFDGELGVPQTLNQLPILVKLITRDFSPITKKGLLFLKKKKK